MKQFKLSFLLATLVLVAMLLAFLNFTKGGYFLLVLVGGAWVLFVGKQLFVLPTLATGVGAVGNALLLYGIYAAGNHPFPSIAMVAKDSAFSGLLCGGLCAVGMLGVKLILYIYKRANLVQTA